MSNQIPNHALPDIDLSNLRIWLSGAVPESKPKSAKQPFAVWSGNPLEHGILGFVQKFSSLVFKYGGHIIHGCHQTLTPILLEQSKPYLVFEDSKRLHLKVSDFFGAQSSQDWGRWKKDASLEIVPRTGDGDEHRDPSLAVLRERMVEECNVFVVIGGLWWHERPGRAGIPKAVSYTHLTLPTKRIV